MVGDIIRFLFNIQAYLFILWLCGRLLCCIGSCKSFTARRARPVFVVVVLDERRVEVEVAVVLGLLKGHSDLQSRRFHDQTQGLRGKIDWALY